jgi:tight adherence protein B
MILTAAPIITMVFINLTSPHFYGDVINEPAVKIGLTLIASWLVIGNLVMRRMIDMRI